MDKKNMAEYLERDRKLEEMRDEIRSQKTLAEEEKEALEMQLQDQIDKSNSQRTMQDSKIGAQEQLMEALNEQHEATINSHQEQHEAAINSLKEQHETAINSQKEQHEAANNSQKEEHEAALNSLREQYEAVIKCLNEDEEFDMLNIMEGRDMDIFQKEGYSEVPKFLAQQSKRRERMRFLLKENMLLWEDVDEKSMRLRKVEEMLTVVKRESNSHKKEVMELRTKCQQLTKRLENRTITRKECQETLAKNEADMAKERQHLSEQCRQKMAKADQLGGELQKERRRRKQLEALMREAVTILRHIMTESEKMVNTEWMMQRLLEILESSAPQGTGSAFKDATEKCVGGQRPQTSVPKQPRAKTPKLSSDPMFLMARYRPGDLGFTTRPRWKLKPTAPLPGSNRLLPLNREPPSRKTSRSLDLSDPAARQED